MIKLEETIKIDRPIAEVFQYAADFANLEQWDPTISSSKKISRGPCQKGSKYNVVVNFAPIPILMRYEVLDYNPPKGIKLIGKAKSFNALDTIALCESKETTILQWTAELSFKGIGQMAEKFMEPIMKRIGRQALAGLENAFKNGFKVKEQKILNLIADKMILPGMWGFTKWGYHYHKKRWNPMTENLKEKTVIITGATSGLGHAAAFQLAKMGSRLIIVGRDPTKTEQTRQEIIDETGNRNIHAQLADLSLMSEVKDLAKRLLQNEPKIHVLINNAGALFNTRTTTQEGNEKSLALLLMAPFLLTNMLLPRLEESKPARVVNVSSGGMYTQKVYLEDLQYESGQYNGSKAYARAKRGLVMMTSLWAEKCQKKGVVVNAMHPGWADTPSVAASLPAFYRITKPVLRNAEQGADTMIWLAASKEAGNYTGQYWLDRQPHTTTVFPGTSNPKKEMKQLWLQLEELTG